MITSNELVSNIFFSTQNLGQEVLIANGKCARLIFVEFKTGKF